MADPGRPDQLADPSPDLLRTASSSLCGKMSEEVVKARHDYGYRSWLVRRAMEGRTTIGDRLQYQTPATAVSAWRPTQRYTPSHPKGVPKKGRPPQNQGFWAPTYGNSRFESNVSKAEKACLRELEKRTTRPTPYTIRMRNALDYDPMPPSVFRTAYNTDTEYGDGLKKFLMGAGASAARYDPNRHMMTDIQGHLKIESKRPAQGRSHTAPHSIMGANAPPPTEEMDV